MNRPDPVVKPQPLPIPDPQREIEVRGRKVILPSACAHIRAHTDKDGTVRVFSGAFLDDPNAIELEVIGPEDQR
jgi:hypothetical protein